MKFTAKNFLRIGLVVAPVLVAGQLGCGSLQNHPVLEALQGGSAAKKVDGQTFVEAYIEYPGPQEKWAGPTSFILHVLAKDATAHIAVTPGWFAPIPSKKGTPSQLEGRKPAASLISELTQAAESERDETIRPLPSDIARERLRYLANAIESGVEEPFQGCLSPVRMRVIRADGHVVEKTGCRSEKGWARVASESVEFFMRALVYGAEG